ncbi:MAG: hypothetical protein AAF125_19865 [Chloroflexota bacterium]
MTGDVYWSDYDIETTLANLDGQNNKDQVTVRVERVGREGYRVSLVCNDAGRTARVDGQLDVIEGERVRLTTSTYHQRNKQLAMVLVPAALGVGAWVASAQGSLIALVAVPLVLIAGSGVVGKLRQPRTMARELLLEAITCKGEPAAPKRRRRRMKKRQWGKGE